MSGPVEGVNGGDFDPILAISELEVGTDGGLARLVQRLRTMPYIEIDGEARPLGPGVLTVGSGPEAGWRLPGRGLDPVHLMLSAQPGGRALLIRASPRSTVLVNGVDLVPVRTLLSFGDRVAIGTAELTYRRTAPGSETPIGFLRDARRGRVYQLRERSTIGRDLGSTVVVHEPDVSRLHAEIIQRGEAYLLVPHGVSVTSVNGTRLIAPTVLQEGDELGVGRSLLRFTTSVPMSSTLVRPASPYAPPTLSRDARAQTTFIGTIEAAEHRSRAAQRRMTRWASVALIVIAAVAVVVSIYVNAHPLPSQPSRRSASDQRPIASSGPGARARPTPARSARAPK